MLRTANQSLSTCLVFGCIAIVSMLAGCTTPTRNPGGYARINMPNLYSPPSFNARIALEKDMRNEVANFDIHPIVGIGFGLVGVRLNILPIEMAFGAFGYPFSRVTPDEGAPATRTAPESRDRRKGS